MILKKLRKNIFLIVGLLTIISPTQAGGVFSSLWEEALDNKDPDLLTYLFQQAQETFPVGESILSEELDLLDPTSRILIINLIEPLSRYFKIVLTNNINPLFCIRNHSRIHNDLERIFFDRLSDNDLKSFLDSLDNSQKEQFSNVFIAQVATKQSRALNDSNSHRMLEILIYLEPKNILSLADFELKIAKAEECFSYIIKQRLAFHAGKLFLTANRIEQALEAFKLTMTLCKQILFYCQEAINKEIVCDEELQAEVKESLEAVKNIINGPSLLYWTEKWLKKHRSNFPHNVIGTIAEFSFANTPEENLIDNNISQNNSAKKIQRFFRDKRKK